MVYLQAYSRESQYALMSVMALRDKRGVVLGLQFSISCGLGWSLRLPVLILSLDHCECFAARVSLPSADPLGITPTGVPRFVSNKLLTTRS